MRWSVLAVIFASACSSSGGRWEPYPGCDARQCEAWYEECTAECINEQKVTVTECRTRCKAKLETCRPACGG
ncbi:MAG TPA: hypothetical protein RMG48_14090 [Myxococcales bacterium LLY-WYZ-16_1]|jgi:hypothetical protein|nr:hypothetical protein [Myxococcales bacterium LLY-WYZ-16_1]